MRWCGALAACWIALLLLVSFTSALAAPPSSSANSDVEPFLGYDKPTEPSLNAVQKILYNYLEPKPLVDTIREEEKYGNEGEVLGAFGRGIVSGTESLTTSFAAAASVPSSVFRQLLKRFTDTLNNIGSRIAGL